MIVVPEMCAVVFVSKGSKRHAIASLKTRALCVAPNGYFEIVLRNRALKIRVVRLFVPALVLVLALG